MQATNIFKKKYIFRITIILLFFVGVVIIYQGLDYLISDDTNAQTRVTFHDFYEEDIIDILFLGSSHSLRSINATKVTEDSGKSVFNLSTASQDFVQAYYTIKEAVDTYDISQIYYEVSISRLKIKEANETATYIISDYLQSPVLRAELIFSSFKPEKYINSFFRLRRNINPMDLPTAETLSEIYEKKMKKRYQEYKGTDNYMGRGQWAVNSSCDYEGTLAYNLNSGTLDNFAVEDIQEKEWEYFLKIIELCKEVGVELTFYITPYTEMYLMGFEDYSEITQLIYDEAGKNQIDIIDLNLVKEEYLNLNISDFYNMDHVSTRASEKIADFFVQYMNNPSQEYFYENLEERYPYDEEVKAIGYRRFFVTDEGEYKKEDKAEGTITDLRLEISATAYADTPAIAKLWAVEQNEETEEWNIVKKISGEMLDIYTTQFVVPYNDLETSYLVQLQNPNSEEILYETITRFDMD